MRRTIGVLVAALPCVGGVGGGCASAPPPPCPPCPCPCPAVSVLPPATVPTTAPTPVPVLGPRYQVVVSGASGVLLDTYTGEMWAPGKIEEGKVIWEPQGPFQSTTRPSVP
jgi:hypothetical protein